MTRTTLRRLLACLPALLVLAWVPAARAETYSTPPPTQGAVAIPAPPDPPPAVTGTAQAGGVLTGSLGTWEPDVALQGRWLRCTPSADSCEDTGDHDGSYAVSAADVGSTMLYRVLGTRSDSVLGLDSTYTADAVSRTIAAAPAAPTAPVNAQPPAITGTARVGERLRVSTGQWTGTAPITYTYAWQSCSPVLCTKVGSSSSYTAAASDRGRRLMAVVTARNAVGARTAQVSTGTVGAAKSTASGLKRLSPFPTLLIDGNVAGATTRISTLRLARVPGGAVVNTSCSGSGCPVRRTRQVIGRGKARTVTLSRLQRRMPAGTSVVITVRKGQTLGKYVRLRFRRAAAPSRVDRCVRPGSSRPVKCS